MIGTVDETALAAALRDGELDPAYRNRLLDAFKHFRD